MKKTEENIHAHSYKVNKVKVNELLADNRSAGQALNGFEKHAIQEGLKELLFGNGPINIEHTVPGPDGISFSSRDLTPAMKQFLLEYGVIELIDDNKISVPNDKIKFYELKGESDYPVEVKRVEINFGISEQLTIDKFPDDSLILSIKALGKFSIPWKDLLAGIEILK